eukprot:scaffold17188_cov126-Skeletonema_dohrnii-CCMP3373.AAC.4
MKRPQSEIVKGANHLISNDLDAIKTAYKRAKAAYEGDKTNKELKKAKKAAKNKLKDAENAAAAEQSSDGTAQNDISKEDSVDGSKNGASMESSSKSDDADDADTSSSSSSPNIKALEDAYQNALCAFKADKTNKDLRRAKTAARRALDTAIAASQPEGSKQLTCLDCSKLFLFTTEEQTKFKKMGWTEMPKRCEACKGNRVKRLADQRSKLDGKKRNMCYAFQKGECPHGANCKFSHNPKHAGGIKLRNNASGREEESVNKESDSDNDGAPVETTESN